MDEGRMPYVWLMARLRSMLIKCVPMVCDKFGWVAEDSSVAAMSEDVFNMVMIMHIHASVLAKTEQTGCALSTFIGIVKTIREHLGHEESDFVAASDGWQVPDFVLGLAIAQITYPPV